MTDSVSLGIYPNISAMNAQTNDMTSGMKQNSSAAESALQSNQSKPDTNTGSQVKNNDSTNQSEVKTNSKSVEQKDTKNTNPTDKKTEENKETKDFKEVIDQKVKSKDSQDESETDTTQVEASTKVNQTNDTEVSAEDLEAAVKEVMATISESLGINLDIDIDLDIKDLDIKDLKSLEAAVELIRAEIKILIHESIENVSHIEIENMQDLATEAELLDDLQTIDEELAEELDAIQNQKEIVSKNQKEIKVDTNENVIDISDMESTEQFELKQVDSIKKVKVEIKTEIKEDQEIKLKQEINLEALQKDGQEKPQEQVKQEIRIEIDKLQDRVSSKLADQIKKDTTNTEVQTEKSNTDQRVNKDGEKFLDKIRFIEVDKTDTIKKTDVKAKINLDAKTKQFLIESARELKQQMTDKIKSRVANVKDVNLELNIRIEDVDITQDSGTGLSSLVNRTFQKLGIQENLQNVKGPDLLNIIQEKAEAAPVNSSQTLKFQLIPKELGKVDITINKDAAGMSIKIVAETDAAVKILKSDMAHLNNVLKDKGVEIKDIEISRSNSEATQNQNQKDDFNEAREEQRRRFAQGKPHWLDEGGDGPSFDNQLEGLLKSWK